MQQQNAQFGPDGGQGRSAASADGPRGTGTVGKALQVLDLVAEAGRPLRLAELQTLSDHPKATLYRLVQTLLREGMLAQEAAGGYVPGLRLMRLAHSAWAGSSLVQVARPHLDRLSAELGETVHLAQLDHGHVLYLDKRNPARAVEMFSATGKIGPAYCTGVGKALLAHLRPPALQAALQQQSFFRFTATTLDGPEALCRELAAIRAAGVAYDREEHEPGIVCAAVPVLLPTGRCLAALSATGTTATRGLAGMEALVPRLRAAAAAIASDAASWEFPEPPVAGRTTNTTTEPPAPPAARTGQTGPALKEEDQNHGRS